MVVGGGHNGLTAGAYLARAGRTVLALEQREHLGGAMQSVQAFPGLDLTLRRRRISSDTPVPGDPTRGLLVDTGDPAATARFFGAVGAAGGLAALGAWGERTAELARTVFPTLTESLPSVDRMRRAMGEQWWQDLVKRPLGEVVERMFASDVVRGVVLTDALIGTFAGAHEASLVQNRCFLYHVIGGGTGDWDVPVGGMGAVLSALEGAVRGAGGEIRTGARATVDPDGGVTWVDADGGEHRAGAGHVVARCSPQELARLLGEAPTLPSPEGAQLKVNMLLTRLPQLRVAAVDPQDAFAGTFHVDEGYAQLERAHGEAAAGRIPVLPPLEIYCHSLTDPSILGPGPVGTHHTLTLFGLHMPARLFREDADGARAEALEATLCSLDSVLGEPIEDCLAMDVTAPPWNTGLPT